MDTGEVHKKDIKEYPENWDDIKEKYLDREEEALKKVLEKRKAETQKELEELAKKAIVTRELRTRPDHKPLKDPAIFKDAKNQDIKKLKQKIKEDFDKTDLNIIKLTSRFPSLAKKVAGLGDLKGRIKQTPPSSAAGE